MHSPYPCQHLVVIIFDFSYFQRYIVNIAVALFCFSSMANDVEHLLIHLLVICLSSVKCLALPFAHFLIGLLFFLICWNQSSFYIVYTSPLIHGFQKLSSICSCIFHPLYMIFTKQNFKLLDKSAFSASLFMDHALVLSQNSA